VIQTSRPGDARQFENARLPLKIVISCVGISFLGKRFYEKTPSQGKRNRRNLVIRCHWKNGKKGGHGRTLTRYNLDREVGLHGPL
jgi:hypothetical protein